MCRGACEAVGTSYEMDYVQDCEAVDNDPALMGIFEEAIKKVLGEDKVLRADQCRPGSEDFSGYLTTGIPGGYLWIEALIRAKQYRPRTISQPIIGMKMP